MRELTSKDIDAWILERIQRMTASELYAIEGVKQCLRREFETTAIYDMTVTHLG